MAAVVSAAMTGCAHNVDPPVVPMGASGDGDNLRARMGGRAAGAGGSHAPGSTGLGAGGLGLPSEFGLCGGMSLAAPEAKDAGASCERLRGERRARCLEELRQAGIEHRSVGPESIGMGSGASSGTATGTNGAPNLGPGTPR